MPTVCGHYTLVEHPRDPQCGEHPDSAAGGSTHHDPTRAASATDAACASWSTMYRHDQGAAQILRCPVNLSVPGKQAILWIAYVTCLQQVLITYLQSCDTMSLRVDFVAAPGIAFERWCIVDDAARRVLYTAVVPAGAPPPDYGWRPTRYVCNCS